MEINKLIEISKELGFSDLTTELQSVSDKLNQENCPIVLPLVGVYSAGKTSLINALTDNKKLEIDPRPTTATIFEVHFGAEKNFGVVIDKDGNMLEFDDISEIKNSLYEDCPIVIINDTNKSINSSTILVDTPGLFSTNPNHRQALVEFLPKADGILLTVDVHTNITKDLVDFVNTISLSNRPIYLILTKCDTSLTKEEVDAQKKNICDNCKISFKQVACVSSIDGNLGEIYSLIDSIQKDKNQILKVVNEHRMKICAQTMLGRVKDLIDSSEDDSTFDKAYNKQKNELDSLVRKIDSLVDSMGFEIDNLKESTQNRFENEIFAKMENLVTGSNTNYDGEAVSTINATSSLLLSDFKISVQNVLTTKARESRNSQNELNLRTLENLDMNELRISGISYDVDLNSAGHKYDHYISNGIKVAGAVAVVALTAGTAAAAAGTAVGGAVASDAVATVADKTIDVADTVTDVASIVSNKKTVSKFEQFKMDMKQNYDKQLTAVENFNQNAAQQLGMNKGLIETLVGFVADKVAGKPQRRKLIHNYIDDSLMPQFRSEMDRISTTLLSVIKATLNSEAQETFAQMNSALEQLRKQKSDARQAFNEKVSKLKDYKRLLQSI